MNFILLIVFIITVAYLLTISLFSIGWLLIKYYFPQGNKQKTFVSIIIPVRNEEKSIQQCIESVIRQDYPSKLFEIIISDDDSSDRTAEITENIIRSKISNNIRLLRFSPVNRSTGKKHAITRAINEARGDLIITTDADCIMGEEWLSTTASFYETFKPKMIIGPVCFSNDNTFWSKINSLEFLSLIGSGAGAARLNMPIMCNGANLAYEKKAFVEAGGFETGSRFASGDDMFLMINIHKKHPGEIKFLKSRKAIVYTPGAVSLKDLWEQRKRWVSKTKGYSNIRIIAVAIIVYLFNLSIAGLLLTGLFFYSNIIIFLWLFLCKAFIDFTLLSGITSFMNKRNLIRWIIPSEFIYIFYVSILGIAGNISSYRWKERKIDN